MSTPSPFSQWSPGLDDAATLRSVYESMPGDDATSIPWYVRLLENPGSLLALPGAVDLLGHDCIHILLGRGMLPEDEAFVLGVTMGASGSLSVWQHQLYAFCARFLFRGPYRLRRSDRLVFDLAVEFGRTGGIRPLHTITWRDQFDRSLGELRAELGVDRARLITVFEAERTLWPRSQAARRLATSSSSRTAK